MISVCLLLDNEFLNQESSLHIFIYAESSSLKVDYPLSSLIKFHISEYIYANDNNCFYCFKA